jgi:phosphopantetheinyl transferase
MKEAIVKLVGTGLFMAMNQIKLDCFVSNVTSVKLMDYQKKIFVHYTEYEQGEHLAFASFIKMYHLHFSEKTEIECREKYKKWQFLVRKCDT